MFPGVFPGHFLLIERYSRRFQGSFERLFSAFSEVFRKVPRLFSGTPGRFLNTFGKNGSGVWRGSGGGSGGLPKEDSYINPTENQALSGKRGSRQLTWKWTGIHHQFSSVSVVAYSEI